MRYLPAVLALVLFEPLAAAHPTGGHSGGSSGGGGRLGQVSGGLGSSGGRGGSSGGGTRVPPPPRPQTEVVDVVYVPAAEGVIAVGGATVVPTVPRKPDGGTAKIEAYIGAQKVYESDGAWTAEVGIRDKLFRLAGSVTRYYEREPDNSQLTLTLPQLVGGVRIDDGGATKAYLEVGLVGAKTRNDPMMDSSLTGGLGGVRLEHSLTRGATVIGTLHEMVFSNDVRAHAATIGVRWGVLQASLRILDFNVGPALYGPELGLRF